MFVLVDGAGQKVETFSQFCFRGMATIPSVMVLYTNDAVEVRYTDGSRLQLSPCGSSMMHDDAPTDNRHPLAGTRGLQKWTQFVTSAHKGKVIQALDFRNRFACRPYLCSSLLPADSIVPLYAKVDQIGWGRDVNEARLEVLEDGSRRVVSCDEYASLVLSPHGQDFTICYLSQISNGVGGSSGGEGNSGVGSSGVGVGKGSDNPPPTVIHHSSPQTESQTPVCSHHNPSPHSGTQQAVVSRPSQTESVGVGENRRSPGVGQDLPDNDIYINSVGSDSQRSNLSQGVSQPNGMQANPCTDTEGRSVLDTSGVIMSVDATPTTPGSATAAATTPGNVTLEQASAFSIMQHDISSISRVSTPDDLRCLVDCDTTLTHSHDPLTHSHDPLTHGQDANPDPKVLHSSPVTATHTMARVGADTVVDKCALAEEPVLNSQPAVPSAECVVSGGVSSNRRDVRVSGTATSTGTTGIVATTQGIGATTSTSRPGMVASASGIGAITTTGQPGIVATTQSNVATTTGNTSASQSSCVCDTVSDLLPTDTTLTDRQGHSSSSGHFQQANCAECAEQKAVAGSSSSSHIQHSGSDTTAPRKTGGPGSTWCGSQQRYTWVTQHFSCSQCPAAWRHPLRLLQQLDPSTSIIVSECGISVVRGAGSTDDSSSQVMSSVPVPVPLACPFQHLHTWQSQEDQHDPYLKQGHFKVIMMDGVIYRFVELSNMRIVEIYPGDGSVIVSQGHTAHFFSHLSFIQGQLKEKIVSLKMLAAMTSAGPNSMERLIKRAHRFLTSSVESASCGQTEEMPCWKRAPLQVVEPMTTSVLEECSVPGYGRFTAYTSGRVRVVFDDRTTLDMRADFSQRLSACSSHSSQAKASGLDVTPVWTCSFDQQQGGQRSVDQCRLLLPSGKYITVELLRPGVYRRYVDAAKEWINWVQSSPDERRSFYQHKAQQGTVQLTAASELKKIECFNYIMDHLGKAHIHNTATTTQDSEVRGGNSTGALGTQTAQSSSSFVPYSTSQQTAYSSTAGGQKMQPTSLPYSTSGQTATIGGQKMQASSFVPYSTLHQTAYSGTVRAPKTQSSTSSFPYSTSQSSTTVPYSTSSQTAYSATIGDHKTRWSQSFVPYSTSAYGETLSRDVGGLTSSQCGLPEGFQAVRETLLRTSQMIKDIDSIVSSRKK